MSAHVGDGPQVLDSIPGRLLTDSKHLAMLHHASRGGGLNLLLLVCHELLCPLLDMSSTSRLPLQSVTVIFELFHLENQAAGAWDNVGHVLDADIRIKQCRHSVSLGLHHVSC